MPRYGGLIFFKGQVTSSIILHVSRVGQDLQVICCLKNYLALTTADF